MRISTGSWGTVVLSNLFFTALSPPSAKHPMQQRSRIASWPAFLTSVAAVLSMALFSQTVSATPTVDGWVFGVDGEDDDGLPDIDQYVLLQNDTSGGSRGKLYHFVDGNTIYLALVASKTVNDNVCARGGNGGDGELDQTYQRTACWNNGKKLNTYNGIDYDALCAGYAGTDHTCNKLVDSDHAEFVVECGARAGDDWTFWIDLADNDIDENDPNNGAWTGGALDDDSTGTITPLPDGFTSMTSFAKNLNASAWDPSLGGVRVGKSNWKSPDARCPGPISPHNTCDDGASIGDINDGGVRIDNYDIADDLTSASNFHSIYKWEWPVVYEFSFDISACSGPLEINPGTSHNSPAKSGGENITFGGGPIKDYGDLPDDYGTTESDGGNAAVHALIFGTELRMGATIDSEADGQPNDAALGDDDSISSTSGSGDDEDGVEFADSADFEGNYTVTVTVTNTTGGYANLCGWIDFDQDDAFQSDESVCVVVGQVADEPIDITFTVPEADWQNNGDFYARFRLTTDSMSTSTPTGIVGDASATASDGEVEDYVVNISNLPVTLSHFESRMAGRNIRFKWSTASETSTLGFNVWGRIEGEWRQLNPYMLANRHTDTVAPQSYRETLPAPGNGVLEAVGMSSVDLDGSEHFYGPFEIGEQYGEAAVPEPIPWQQIQAEVDRNLEEAGYTKKHGKWRKPVEASLQGKPSAGAAGAAPVPLINLETSLAGVHRVTYEQLRGAGLDLAGVAGQSVAVIHKGEPVARYVEEGPGRGFGTGGYIDFYAEIVDEADKRYTKTNVYRVVVDAGLVRDAGFLKERGKPAAAPRYYIETVKRDVNLGYGLNMPAAEPWYEHRLLGVPGHLTGTADMELTLDHLVPGPDDERTGIRLGLAAISHFRGEQPDHNIKVHLNGGVEPLADLTSDGLFYWDVFVPVPGGGFREGANTLRVEVPGVDGYPADLMYGDTYAIAYPREFVARSDVLTFEEQAEAFEASGFSSTDIVAYAMRDGVMTRLKPRVEPDGGSFAARIPGLAGSDARYWMSSKGALPSPEVINAGAPADLATPAADYVIVAHANFIDRLENADNFLRAKQDQGYSVKIVDVADVYQQYGHGLPLPDAIRAYLAAQNAFSPVQQVLLVGGATSDPMDYTGSGSIDFVPTYFARTGRLIYHTPADGLIADIHGEDGVETEPDGRPDVSIGRWPVRTVAELDAIIAKTLRYQKTMASNTSALLAADATDAAFPSFSGQIERVASELTDAGGEPWSELTRVFLDDFDSVGDARAALIQGLNDGHAVTLYSGHGSSIVWSWDKLLRVEDAAILANADAPTIVGTISCYTSYFVTPTMDTLAHQLLLSSGGAAMIHGAATLSGFSQNEVMLGRATAAMADGTSAGEAVLEARRSLGDGYSDVITNWAVLGDPSLRLAQ